MKLVALFLTILPVVVAIGSGGGFVPFLLATKRVRVLRDRAAGLVVLRSVDPAAMVVVGGVLSVLVCCVFALRGACLGLCVGAFAGVLGYGTRITVRVRVDRTRVVRSIAYVIPWSVHEPREAPDVFVDGWGDSLDPECLQVAYDARRVELAWNYRDSGVDLEAIARDFNEAVCALRT